MHENSLTHGLELTTIVFSVKIWRHYLCGVHVDVLTNHEGLNNVFT